MAMGKRGRAVIEAEFQVTKGIDQLAVLFRQSVPPSTKAMVVESALRVDPQEISNYSAREGNYVGGGHNGHRD
jgi:hypothetical protein